MKPAPDLEAIFDTTDTVAKAEIVRLAADTLCAAMKSVHGGEWRVRIDHQRQMVLVRAA